MSDAASAAISLGGGVASSVLNTGINLLQARANRKYNEKMQREAWARDDSAYQRKVADLKKAGINPMLATDGGAMQSSPPPAAPMASIDTSGIAHGASKAADAILASQQLKMQKDLNNAQIALLAAQKDKTQAETPGATAQSGILQKTLDNYDQAAADIHALAENTTNSGEKQRELIDSQIEKLQADMFSQHLNNLKVQADTKISDQNLKNLEQAFRSLQARAHFDEKQFPALISKIDQDISSGKYLGNDLSEATWYRNLEAILKLLGAPLRGIIDLGPGESR